MIERASQAWNTTPVVAWGRCWFGSHESAHGPHVNAPCAQEWSRQVRAQGGTVEWIDGYVIAFRALS